MKVSATEEYGVRCLIRLAEAHRQGRHLTIPDVARAEGLSPEYVAKLTGILRRAGLVTSLRGVNGGVRLSREPGSITLADAIEALSGTPLRLRQCLTDGEHVACTHLADCGLREVWSTLTTLVLGVLSNVTMADLASGPVPPTVDRRPSTAPVEAP